MVKCHISNLEVVPDTVFHPMVEDIAVGRPSYGKGRVLEIQGHLAKVSFGGGLNILWRDLRSLKGHVTYTGLKSETEAQPEVTTGRQERNRAERRARALREADAKRERDADSKASRLSIQSSSQEAAKKKAAQKSKQKK
ncbi:MAG: hypothetical protein Q7S19_03020 [bacterium]|nr:hypothetical protein [bacterium]